MAAVVRAGFGSLGCAAPTSRAGLPAYGETFSGTPSCLYEPFRLRRRTTIGAPSAITRAPGAGDCETTTLAANPGTEPSTRHAKPPCSSEPFAKT